MFLKTVWRTPQKDACWHYPVDDPGGIIRKTGELAKILAGKELHLEETVPVKTGTKILYDPSIEGIETNMTHVDYKYTTVSTQERNVFGKLGDAEFKLRGWSKRYNGPD